MNKNVNVKNDIVPPFRTYGTENTMNAIGLPGSGSSGASVVRLSLPDNLYPDNIILLRIVQRQNFRTFPVGIKNHIDAVLSCDLDLHIGDFIKLLHRILFKIVLVLFRFSGEIEEQPFLEFGDDFSPLLVGRACIFWLSL